MKIRIVFYILFLTLLSHFVMCEEATQRTEIIVSKTDSLYAQSIQEFLPQIHLVPAPHTSPLQNFSRGKNIEIFASQAQELVNTSNDYKFTPHYIKTVVIAVDRSQTSQDIRSFSDVLQSNSPINFNFGKESAHRLWTLPEAQHIVLSMAKALYGSYDVHAVAKNFYTLNIENRFFCNDTSQPISIMYDSQAVELITQGRNIDIIIPQEGTLSFVGGLLSYKNAQLQNFELNSVLAKNGLRTINETTKEPYPTLDKYRKAQLLSDFSDFNRAAVLVGPILRREAFEYEQYGFLDNNERSVFFLSFLIIMVGYIISVNRRISHKKIRSAIATVCCLQIMLVTMGCLKALIVDHPIIETVLWYGYYFAFVFIPAIYLYVAIVSGKNKELEKLPTLYKIHLGISSLLVLFVCTNNIHGRVFTVYNYMNSTFDYNTGYYIVMGWIYITTCAALAILMYKAFLMPRKSALLLPFLMNIFTIIFMIGYARRIPIFYDIDFAYSINIIILLYMEACIQSKLLPVNMHYRKMFSNSSLCMEIHDKHNRIIERSLTSTVFGRDYILRKTLMPSGSFLYYEDYTELNKAKDKLSKANNQLKENIQLLKKQGEVKAELASLAAEKAVYRNIDVILNHEMLKIDSLLTDMQKISNTRRLMGQINIVVCAIKRKCILRINTLYKKIQSVEDFLNCIGEMQEFAKHLPLKITIGCTFMGPLSIQQSMRMYEIFCDVIELAAKQECSDILIQLYEEADYITFSIIPDKEVDITKLTTIKNQAVEEEEEKISIKNWYESTAILVSLKKEVKSSD